MNHPLAASCLVAFLISSACAAGSDTAPVPVEGPPGAPSFSPELKAQLKQAVAAKGPAYKPRTHHLQPDGSPTYTNRLILESSPYLNQHAHNPVNWYPWGDEAFETAKRLGRPVLLSIGYSTCHWCHVMEAESFEDEEIARYLNEHYIVIKVDREERPDIDAVYMSAVQALTGRGGWPMTVWLTPDRKPFYGGTYFPARDGDRGARTGFATIIRVLADKYAADPDKIASEGERLATSIRGRLTGSASGDIPNAATLSVAFNASKQRFDATNGGTAGAPKFPSSLPIRLLLRQYKRTGEAEALRMAALTLEKMAAGGIHDQIGGGFHRYATDPVWLVPHFEKMLYDNALLTIVYLEGYQATGRQEFADVARDILGYVAREMTAPEGGFYSATDADSLTSEGEIEEGWFFTWTPAELAAALGPKRAPAVAAWYGVTTEGNFDRRNILHLERSAEDIARRLGIAPDQLRRIVSGATPTLLAVRDKRPHPLRDDKILTSWNGLMISAFARGGMVLDDADDIHRASRAADFVLAKLRVDGRLLRSYKDGRGRLDGYLDDYAFMIQALLDLYEATGNVQRLGDAIGLQKVLDEGFADAEGGGYFATSGRHETLLAREKPDYDGAEPSGNSVALMNLLRLGEMTTDDGYRVKADRLLRAFGGTLKRQPLSLSEMLIALDFRVGVPKEILIVTPSSRAEAEPFLARLRKAFVPNRILAVAVQGADLDAQVKHMPLLEGKVAAKGKATAYVCERGVCRLPTTDPETFAKELASVAPRPD